MFQSSRMASGIWRWQASIASSPFSASMISKSRPSRILRATLRITLESSTTRQVFIVSHSSFAGEPAATVLAVPSIFMRRGLGGGRVGAQVEHPIDVQHDQELAVEAVYAGRQGGEPAVEIDRIGLAVAVRQLEHFADAVDQQPERFAAGFDADRHGGGAVVALF